MKITNTKIPLHEQLEIFQLEIDWMKHNLAEFAAVANKREYEYISYLQDRFAMHGSNITSLYGLIKEKLETLQSLSAQNNLIAIDLELDNYLVLLDRGQVIHDEMVGLKQEIKKLLSLSLK